MEYYKCLKYASLKKKKKFDYTQTFSFLTKLSAAQLKRSFNAHCTVIGGIFFLMPKTFFLKRKIKCINTNINTNLQAPISIPVSR